MTGIRVPINNILVDGNPIDANSVLKVLINRPNMDFCPYQSNIE